jgi:GNAT superfamily N-acetyltransferase
VRSPAAGWLESVSSCHTFGRDRATGMAWLHVSAPWRATGIGSHLSEQLEQIARTVGDSDIVVSANPSLDGFLQSSGLPPTQGRLHEPT